MGLQRVSDREPGRAPPRHAHGDLTSLAPHERLPEILVVPRQRNQRSNCQHLLDHGKSKRVPEKNIYFCFIDYAKGFDCVDHNKVGKILKEMGIPDHLTCLLRNLYLSTEGNSSCLAWGSSISCLKVCLRPRPPCRMRMLDSGRQHLVRDRLPGEVYH